MVNITRRGSRISYMGVYNILGWGVSTWSSNLFNEGEGDSGEIRQLSKELKINGLIIRE